MNFLFNLIFIKAFRREKWKQSPILLVFPDLRFIFGKGSPASHLYYIFFLLLVFLNGTSPLLLLCDISSFLLSSTHYCVIFLLIYFLQLIALYFFLSIIFNSLLCDISFYLLSLTHNCVVFLLIIIFNSLLRCISSYLLPSTNYCVIFLLIDYLQLANAYQSSQRGKTVIISFILDLIPDRSSEQFKIIVAKHSFSGLWFFHLHVSTLKLAPSHEFPLTARKTVFSHLKNREILQ